jgi:hypothetical protein
LALEFLHALSVGKLTQLAEAGEVEGKRILWSGRRLGQTRPLALGTHACESAGAGSLWLDGQDIPKPQSRRIYPAPEMPAKLFVPATIIFP